MSGHATDMLATAIVQFQVEARGGDEALVMARDAFQSVVEDSDLIGDGGLGPLLWMGLADKDKNTYLASATALFRVIVPEDGDAMSLASEMLQAEIADSPIFSSGAVCTVVDD